LRIFASSGNPPQSGAELCVLFGYTQFPASLLFLQRICKQEPSRSATVKKCKL
jgi:hypothetical protein